MRAGSRRVVAVVAYVLLADFIFIATNTCVFVLLYSYTCSRGQGGGARGRVTVAVVAYVLLAAFTAALSSAVPQNARRPPFVVFALWLLFGILGVHLLF